jgi:hypothetical protein
MSSSKMVRVMAVFACSMLPEAFVVQKPGGHHVKTEKSIAKAAASDAHP